MFAHVLGLVFVRQGLSHRRTFAGQASEKKCIGVPSYASNAKKYLHETLTICVRTR
jgi:hypothetical protein